jgi:hypothetical protein
MKRKLSKAEQLRNVGYLCLIALSLLCACLMNHWYVWAWFLATAWSFWPQGHYGRRGV